MGLSDYNGHLRRDSSPPSGRGNQLSSVSSDGYSDEGQREFDHAISLIESYYKDTVQLRKSVEHYELQWRLSARQNTDFLKQLEEKNKKLNSQFGNNYALVLIDGDGMIFKKDLIKEGITGGKKAADRLYRQVSNSTALKPIIRVFANVEGLSRAFKTGGLISSTSIFREFTVGFTDPAHEHIDFIDVGEGKEMADWKIRSELKWHLKNYNCSSVILGVSHDNGYTRVLNEVSHEHEDAFEKIQLLQGPPFARELDALRYKRLKYPDVFSSEKFDASQQQQPRAIAPPPGLSSVGTWPTASESYAAAITAPAAMPPSPKQTKVVQVSEMSVKDAVWRIKSMNKKPCNNFYLKGECGYTSDECKFAHDLKLEAHECQAMRKLAFNQACNWGLICKNEKCYYSHPWDEHDSDGNPVYLIKFT